MGSMARGPSFSAVLCFNSFTREGGAFSIFLAEWAVLLQNSSQLLPLLQMKLVISQKAWNVTACWSGILTLGLKGWWIVVDNDGEGRLLCDL